VGDSSNGEENRSPWRRVFLAVEAPGFTGLDSRRSRRNAAVFIAALLATVAVIVYW
jgi:hypothetical protein